MEFLSLLPRKTEVTFWSLYGLALSYFGPTGAGRMDTGPTWSMPQQSGDGQVRFRFAADGTVSQIPKEQRFDDIHAQHLGGNLKSFYQRAREVFQFCLIKRPGPTKFGRYGIGSYKTVLGIGNAPKT